jgi:hypothetical protein
MPTTTSPIIAITGNITTDTAAPKAAEALGRELAKAGFRILVYSSDTNYAECHVVHGYIESRQAARRSVQVRYSFHQQKPDFPEQTINNEVFDWQPDHSEDWEMSFYQSLSEVDGILLIGGGGSTLIAGLVAMGHGIAMLPLATFGGNASKVWKALRPGRDLPSADEVPLMARPVWNDDQAAECMEVLKNQIARKIEQERLVRLKKARRETSVALHAIFALALFVLSFASVAVAWATKPSLVVSICLLFISPLLAGVAGSTIRLVFDLRQGSVPLTQQSAITTAALGLVAGGIAGLLFITAQVTTAPAVASAAGQTPDIIMVEQARKLVAFAVLIGFIAGLTLDAVFRKLITSDVVDVSVVEAKKRT